MHKTKSVKSEPTRPACYQLTVSLLGLLESERM